MSEFCKSIVLTSDFGKEFLDVPQVNTKKFLKLMLEELSNSSFNKKGDVMHSGCLDEITKLNAQIKIEKDNEIITELNNINTAFTAADLILDDEQTARAKEFTDNLINTSEITYECILPKSHYYYLNTKQERKWNYLMKHGSNKRIRTKNFKRFYGDKMFEISFKG